MVTFAWLVLTWVGAARCWEGGVVKLTPFSRFIGPQTFEVEVLNASQIVRVSRADLCSSRRLLELDLRGKIVVSKTQWACDLERQHKRLTDFGVVAFVIESSIYRTPGFHWNYHYKWRKWRQGVGAPMVAVYATGDLSWTETLDDWTETLDDRGTAGELAALFEDSHRLFRGRKGSAASADEAPRLVLRAQRNKWRATYRSSRYLVICRGLLGLGKCATALVAVVALRARLRPWWSSTTTARYYLPVAALSMEILSLLILGVLWVVGAGYADPTLPFYLQFACMTGFLGSRLGASVCASIFWLETARLFQVNTFVSPHTSNYGARESPAKLALAAMCCALGISTDVYMIAAKIDSSGFFLRVYTLMLLLIGAAQLLSGSVFLHALHRRLGEMSSLRHAPRAEKTTKLTKGAASTMMAPDSRRKNLSRARVVDDPPNLSCPADDEAAEKDDEALKDEAAPRGRTATQSWRTDSVSVSSSASSLSYARTATYARLAASFKRATVWYLASAANLLLFGGIVLFLAILAARRGRLVITPSRWYFYAIFLDVARSASSFCAVMSLDFRGDVAQQISQLLATARSAKDDAARSLHRRVSKLARTSPQQQARTEHVDREFSSFGSPAADQIELRYTITKVEDPRPPSETGPPRPPPDSPP